MISVVQLGTVDYGAGLRLQQRLVTLRKEEKIGDVLLLLEHKPVITLGRNAKTANVIASTELLAQRGVELFECDRGGDVTFHGPGQIVGYPIFDLRGYARWSATDHVGTAALESLPRAQSRGPVEQSSTGRKHLGAVDFVRRLEDVLMRTCADFGIPTKRVPGLTGVWTDAVPTANHVGTAAPGCPVERSSTTAEENTRSPFDALPLVGCSGQALDSEGRFVSGSSFSARDDKNREGHDFSRAANDSDKKAALAAEVSEAKLAAIGIHISRFVTSHGFALNVNTDLSYFNLIIPCGIASKPVTSMQRELNRELDLNFVAESISRNFGVVFQSQILWVDTLGALLGRTVGVPIEVPEKLRQGSWR